MSLMIDHSDLSFFIIGLNSFEQIRENKIMRLTLYISNYVQQQQGVYNNPLVLNPKIINFVQVVVAFTTVCLQY